MNVFAIKRLLEVMRDVPSEEIDMECWRGDGRCAIGHGINDEQFRHLSNLRYSGYEPSLIDEVGRSWVAFEAVKRALRLSEQQTHWVFKVDDYVDLQGEDLKQEIIFRLEQLIQNQEDLKI